MIKVIKKDNTLENFDCQKIINACKKASIPFVWASYGFGKPDDENYFAKIENFSDLLKVL